MDSGYGSQSTIDVAGKETVVIFASTGNVSGGGIASLDAADCQHDPTGHVRWGKLVVVGEFLLCSGGLATGP